MLHFLGVFGLWTQDELTKQSIPRVGGLGFIGAQRTVNESKNYREEKFRSQLSFVIFHSCQLYPLGSADRLLPPSKEAAEPQNCSERHPRHNSHLHLYSLLCVCMCVCNQKHASEVHKQNTRGDRQDLRNLWQEQEHVTQWQDDAVGAQRWCRQESVGLKIGGVGTQDNAMLHEDN
jgi:hypothetical protein